MKQNIIIVDNFYQHPDEIRNIALTKEYPEPEEEFTYPGKNSKGSFYSKELHEKFERVVNKKLDPADQNGYFRISLEKDTHKQDIHVDPSWDWGAVIYLTLPEHCVDEGGTSFWKHNTLGMEMCPKNDLQARHYGYPTYKEAWWTTIYGDGQDRSKWSQYFSSPMRYNRMVMLRTYLWHSHSYNFGKNLNNGRLVQLFFFNENEKNV